MAKTIIPFGPQHQFPLLETEKEITFKKLEKLLKDHDLVKDFDFELSLFNEEVVVHKLSHQHLYTKFWILTLNNVLEEGVAIKDIHHYPVPILIENFIKAFNF